MINALIGVYCMAIGNEAKSISMTLGSSSTNFLNILNFDRILVSVIGPNLHIVHLSRQFLKIPTDSVEFEC